MTVIAPPTSLIILMAWCDGNDNLWREKLPPLAETEIAFSGSLRTPFD